MTDKKYTPKDVHLVVEMADGTKHVVEEFVTVPEVTVNAIPNGISLDDAFAIVFEKYKNAFWELSKK